MSSSLISSSEESAFCSLWSDNMHASSLKHSSCSYCTNATKSTDTSITLHSPSFTASSSLEHCFWRLAWIKIFSESYLIEENFYTIPICWGFQRYCWINPCFIVRLCIWFFLYAKLKMSAFMEGSENRRLGPAVCNSLNHSTHHDAFSQHLIGELSAFIQTCFSCRHFFKPDEYVSFLTAWMIPWSIVWWIEIQFGGQKIICTWP